MADQQSKLRTCGVERPEPTMRGRRGVLIASALAAVLALASPPCARAQVVVDLELVLAVDASGSVDNGEYALQIGGIAEAFRNPAVSNAIAGGMHKRIAVALVIWADADAPKDVTGWWIIDSTADAFAFAAFVEARPRLIKGGTTGIGSGIAAGVHHLRTNEIAGRRMVIDVSGDGTENSVIRGQWPDLETTLALSEARRNAEALGITINGLAILNDVHDLAEWYEVHVRSGPRSFVMVADDYADFATAILAKLLREIGAGPAVTDLGDQPRKPAAQMLRLSASRRFWDMDTDDRRVAD